MRLFLVFLCFIACSSEGPNRRGGGERLAPVEVAPITSGPIAQRRTFSGTLEARASIDVSPKVTGRVEKLYVDLADPVTRGQVVAELEKGDLVQAVRTAEADLAVARAGLAAAKAQRTAAEKNLQRFKQLADQRVVAPSQFDEAQAADLSAKAAVDQAVAAIARAKANLDGARIRLGYTRVVANWSDGDDSRVIAERFVDAGDLVPVNSPLFSVVETDPLTAVFFVTERDYADLEAKQNVTLTTDAYRGEVFAGQVERIAPVFESGSRQARVEVLVENSDGRLKPGMFIRAQIELNVVQDAKIVPEVALVRRNDSVGVFEVSPDGKTVAWKTVSVGIREGNQVQVIGEITGRVVTLGHQLIEDGASVRIPQDPSVKAASRTDKGEPSQVTQ
ncbi:MAG: efflux RND transporter periplasmic adaptor subunit [Myxococcota bacterium]